MGYEIYIWPKDEKKSTALDSFVKAFHTAGLSPTVESDDFGHWLVFGSHESALHLEVKNEVVKRGGMKFGTTDDPALLTKIVAVLRGLAWAVGDDEGELE